MNKFTGSYCSKRKGLNEIEPLLKKWLKVLEKYENTTGGDQAYWYTEMSNVSSLAAAAWKQGYVATCEFQHEKGAKNSSQKFVGRGDLYICTDKWDYYFEAKQENLSLDFQGDLVDRLSQEMSVAVHDARNTAKAPHGNRENKGEFTAFGIVFYVFYLPPTKQDALQSRIVNVIDELKIQEPFHAAAWYFPQSQLDQVEDDGEYIFPGVIMVIENQKFSEF